MNLHTRLKAFSQTPEGYWLDCLPWEDINIKPLKFQLQGLITAFYCSLTDIIYAAPDKDQRVYFGTVCHELYHAYQRYNMGLFKYLLLKCFCRKTLQIPAKEVQLAAVQWACEQHI